MLEQLRNDVNSSNLMENAAGEDDDSYSDEAHVSVENRNVNDGGFDNESFAVGSQQ